MSYFATHGYTSAVELSVVLDADYVGIHRALGPSFFRSGIFQLLTIFDASFSGPANSAPPNKLHFNFRLESSTFGTELFA